MTHQLRFIWQVIAVLLVAINDWRRNALATGSADFGERTPTAGAAATKPPEAMHLVPRDDLRDSMMRCYHRIKMSVSLVSCRITSG